MNIKKERPQGREAVRQALIEAAAELFSKYGVEAVSIRDIAARAKVNHGLIHRHFGSKERLRRETQEYLAAGVRGEIGLPETLEEALLKGFAALKNHPSFWRVMARTFLDGEDHGDVQSDFPFIQYLVALAQKAQAEGRMDARIDPRYVIASIVSYGLGMLVFERYILQGSGLDTEPRETVEHRLNEMLAFYLRTSFGKTE